MWNRKKGKLGKYQVFLLLVLIPFVLSSCITTGLGDRLFRKKSEPQEKVVVREEGIEKKEGKRTVEKAAERPTRIGKKYAEVIGDAVNMRAGADLNYEILGKLNKGQRVIVLGETVEWYEIELPAGWLVWIYSDLVSAKEAPSPGKKVIGEVKGDSVRVRAKPGLKNTVLTKVNKGDKVVIVDLEGDWFGIEAPEGCTGWVFSKYIMTPSR